MSVEGGDAGEAGRGGLEVFEAGLLTVEALNGLWLGGEDSLCDEGLVGDLTPNQCKAADFILGEVREFCARDAALGQLQELVEKARILHQGEVNYDCTGVYRAEGLDPSLVAMPAAGVAGCIELMDFVSSGVAEQLRHPDSMVLPPEEWPTNPRTPKVWASQAVWNEVGLRAIKSGVFAWYDGAPLRCGGFEVLAGCFGVEKWKVLADGTRSRQQRLIINPGSNGFLRRINGALAQLFYADTLGQIVLSDGEILIVSETDQSNCFYLFKMPPEWRKFFVLSKSVFDPESKRMLRVACHRRRER